MTHNEMASAIRNRVADGLDGNLNNQAFSLGQLREEIDLMRADFAHKYAQTNKLDPKFLVQDIDANKLECQNLSDDCIIKGYGENVPTIEIPKLLPLYGEQALQYVGLMNMQESFAVYFDPQDIRNHKYRIKTKHRPFVWVDTAVNNNDMMVLRFFNWGSWDPLKWVRVRGIFEHPMRVNIENPTHLDMEYPAPLHMQNSILDALTEKYVRYFRQLNTPKVPNTQSDNIT